MKQYLPVYEGRVALACFIVSISFLPVHLALNVQPIVMSVLESVCMGILVVSYPKPILKVIGISFTLGSLFGVGLWIASSGEDYRFIGVYLVSLVFFHFSEYVTTSIFNAHTLSIDSFLINHSREYGIAAIVSWIEYTVEFYFFPQMKSIQIIGIVGTLMVVFGELLRKVAMFTAGSNFTHVVQYRKRDTHKLVTTGVYSLFRHPSYVGWFYWSIGTQVLLCNPICFIGYTFASWSFFNDRIFDEEETLIQFFKEDYSVQENYWYWNSRGPWISIRQGTTIAQAYIR